MSQAAPHTSPSPLWMRVGVVAVVVAIFAVYGLVTRRPPLTLEESQAYIDQRIDELEGYLHPPAAFGTPAAARQLALATGAAGELERLLQEDPAMERIEIELFGDWSASDWSADDWTGPDPEARAAALAHPALRDLLEAWSSGTVEPSEKPSGSLAYLTLHRFSLEALADATHRGDSEASALWVMRSLDLVETQLLRQEFFPWCSAASLLRVLADRLEAAPPLGLGEVERETLLERVRALPSVLASPQEAGAFLMIANLRAIRDEQPSFDGAERADTIHFLREVRPWNDRSLAVLAMDSEPERERRTAVQRAQIESLSEDAQVLAAYTDNLPELRQDAMEAIARILAQLVRR